MGRRRVEMKLTFKQKERYILIGGVRCPYCESDNIETVGPVETEQGGALQKVRCLACQKKWTDYYKLFDVEEEKD